MLDRLKLVKKNNIIFDKLDARNYKRLTKSINKFSPDVVIHLAAVSHANKSNKNPYTTFDHSLRTLENAIDAVRNKKVHFIYFSSSMVYGDFKKNIVSETDQLKPKGIYGSLKLAGELLVKAYKQAFNLNYTILDHPHYMVRDV